MSDLPSFIKVATVSTSKTVIASSQSGATQYQASIASKVVGAGYPSPPAQSVVLALLSKGVKSADDTPQPFRRFLGKTAFVVVEDQRELNISYGSLGATPIAESEKPRYTRFSAQTIWG